MQKLLLLVLLLTSFTAAKAAPPKLYELRVYYCEPGRLDALMSRFRDHTTKLFEKHGMENVGYFTPTKEGNNALYYILSYPDMAAREASWKAFIADPAWKEAQKNSELSGKIITKIESTYMTLNPELTKKIKSNGSSSLFEFRRYYCLPTRYPNIVARFRDHTMKLFKSHGMKNLMYFETQEKDNAQPNLLYFLAHKNAEAAKKSWDEFRKNPKWTKVRDQSELSGKIVERVESVYMVGTDFSKMK